MLGRLLAFPLGRQRHKLSDWKPACALWTFQQHRGKKRKANCWGRTSAHQQSNFELYEKRLKRRVGNRELKRLLISDSEDLPSIFQFEERVRVATGGRPSPQAHSRHHRRSGKRRSHSKQGSSDQAKAEDTEEPAEWWNGFYAENDPADSNPGRWYHIYASWQQKGSGFFWGTSGPFQRSNFGAFKQDERPYTPRDPQEEQAKEHLRTLGLGSAAGVDAEKLRAAFLREALAWHPDKHGSRSEADRAAAEERFKRIQIAYDFLGEYLGNLRQNERMQY